MDMEPKEITGVESANIIVDHEPRGLFWQKDGDIYVGINNTTGDAWTADFNTLDECLAWLKGGQHNGQ